ncbi:MAG TPA: hypothetical protein DEB47_17625 [Citreicella sp.]|nr:hypothetical protein [Citreicella sp.]
MTDRDEIVRRMHAEGATDGKIAAAFGVSRVTARTWRVNLGLEVCKGRPGLVELFEQIRALHAEGLTDRQISDKLGIPRHRVQTRRYRMGLDCNSGDRPSEKISPETEASVRALHAKGLLDQESAKRLGISARQVERVRARLGLPSNRHRRVIDQDRLRQLHAEGLNDNQISRAMGCSNTSISSLRAEMGLRSNYQVRIIEGQRRRHEQMSRPDRPVRLPGFCYTPPNDAVARALRFAFGIPPSQVEILTALEPHLARAMRASA